MTKTSVDCSVYEFGSVVFLPCSSVGKLRSIAECVCRGGGEMLMMLTDDDGDAAIDDETCG